MKRLASRSKLMFVAVVTTTLSWGAAPAFACNAGPTAAPTAAVSNLEEDATQWGTWCGGSAPTVAVSASAQQLLIDFQHSGGAATEFTHVYRNLLPDLTADTFKMTLDFNYQPKAGVARAEAVQFSMNSWRNGLRYEWAVEWLAVGSSNTWRFWDGHRFVDLGVSRDLTPGAWHRIELAGTITTGGNVLYKSFRVDGHTTQVRLQAAPIPYPEWPDQLAVATTMVGPSSSSFQMYLDNVTFDRTTMGNASVDALANGTTNGQSSTAKAKKSK